MKIFEKRPLSLILCIMLGGFFFFYGKGTVVNIIGITLALCVASFTAVYSIIKKTPKRLLIIGCAVLIISILLSWVYSNCFTRYEKFTDECKIVATVKEKSQGDLYCTYTLSVESVNEERYLIMPDMIFSGVSYDYAGINEGTKISLSARIDVITQETENGSYYISKGIGARLEAVEDVQILSQNNFTIDALFSEIREFISRHAVMISDKDTGGLLSALLLGEKSMLSGKISLDFKRIGITHILALSGMHLAILSLGISKLLGAIGLGKKVKSVFIIIFTLSYMIFTGMSVSVVRAGIMLILSTLLYLLSSSHDSITSLCVAAFLIVLFTPYAILDTSLWLSAFATLGVIVFSEYDGKKARSENLILRCLKRISSLFLVSLFAIGITYIITVSSFETISVLSPVSTLIFSPIIQVFIYVGIIALIFGSFLPVGKILIAIKSIIVYISSYLSSLNFAIFSTESPVVKLLLFLVFVGFVLFFVLSIKHKRIFVTVLSLIFVISLSVGIGISQSKNLTDEIIYSEQKSGDNILIKSNGVAFLADVSRFSTSTAYSSYEFLSNSQVTRLSGYYVSHYSKSLPQAIDKILRLIKIDMLYLPLPQNDDERILSESIKELTLEYEADVEYYLAGGNINVGDYVLMPRYTTVLGGGTNKSALSILAEGEYVSYLSSGMLEDKAKAVAEAEIENAQVLLLGSHGKSYNNEHYIEFEKSDLRLISINSDNVYFTQDALKYYDEIGCKILKSNKNVLVIKH